MWRNRMSKCRLALLKSLLMVSVAISASISYAAELPDLSGALIFGGEGVSTASYKGGASSDDGNTYRSDFNWKDSIDATVEITVQTGDVGETGSIYVLIYIPGFGFLYQDSNGQYQPLTSFDAITPRTVDKTLDAMETVSVFTNMVLNDLGLDGFTFNIWAGYSVSTNSSAIHYHTTPVTINSDPIPDFTDANEATLALETAKQHISTSTPLNFYVDLDEAAENLVISFAQGIDGAALGDPDLYVKYGEAATTSNFDCVSYRSSGSNESCIISKPQAGRYHIHIDAFEGGDVIDATLWASVDLLTANRSCNDNLVIQAQSMTEAELDTACAQINRAGDVFFDVFANISPAPGVPVDGDLNEVTNFTVFSSLSNHRTWINYLWNDSTNASGIYYETSPTDWWHRSNIISFNPIEWTDGLSMIRSGAHEYIHALDGRYNKEGAYMSETGWWSEGLAEYMGNFYDTPFDRFEISLSDSPPTLAEIFDQHNNGGVPSPYTWGQMAVAYFIQVHPGQVALLVEHMRAGAWDDWNFLLATWANVYQDGFAAWLTTGPRSDFENSAQALQLGSYALVEGRSGWLFSVDVADGTDSVTFSLSGGSSDAGSMDVDMMVSAGVVPHTSLNNVDCAPKLAGNDEVCTLTTITAGTYYITLDVANSWAADIVDVYLSACAGTDCTVSLPAPKEIREVVDFPLPVLEELPDANTIGGCEYVRPYTRSSAGAEITITNTTDTPVNLYWINSSSGEPVLSNLYATLQLGENYTADFWAVGDRMMIADLNNNCLGVAVLTESSNTYEIDAELVVNADSSQIEVSTIGGCDLVSTYTRTNTAASINVTNTTSTPVTLYWVYDSTGEAYLPSPYATLQEGETYTADYWVVGDRMMIADANDNCLGVAELTATTNVFEVDAALVGGITNSNFDALSSCDLAVPYSRTGAAASISVTNTTSNPVTLYWVHDGTGDPYTPSPYATLEQGQTYFADFWVIGDRMMLSDASGNCLAIADLTKADNVFEIDESLFN